MTSSTVTPQKRTRSSVRLGSASSQSVESEQNSEILVTPTKNKIDNSEAGSSSKRLKLTHADTQLYRPNPPSAPFPLLTPPHSTHKKRNILVDSPEIFSSSFSSNSGVDGSRSFPNFSPAKSTTSCIPKDRRLPAHLDTLLALHNAFDLSFSLHLATHPPILPPLEEDALSSELEFGDPLVRHLASPSKRRLKAVRRERQVQLENLTNYLAIKNNVEQTCQKRFGITELKRLCWLWDWDGESVLDTPDRNQSTIATTIRFNPKPTDINPFLDSPNPIAQRGAPTYPIITKSGFVVSQTRCLDPLTGRRVHTYGMGIQVSVNIPPPAGLEETTDGFETLNRGAGAGAVGRWSAGGKKRTREMEEKLWKWCLMHGDAGDDAGSLNHGIMDETSTGLPTPSASGSSDRMGESIIPAIPLMDLPPLPAGIGSLLTSGNSSTPSTPASSRLSGAVGSKPVPPNAPARPRGLVSVSRPTLEPMNKLELSTSSSLGAPAEISASASASEDVFGPVIRIEKIHPAGSAAARRQALYDRIQARTNGKAAAAVNGDRSSSNLHTMVNSTPSERRAELKRRSTLSRLENVAETVWMHFTLSTAGVGVGGGTGGGPSGSPGMISPRARRRAFPMSEVMNIIVKSSKTPISSAEAYDSLGLLVELCPWFLVVRHISKQEWLEMPASAQQHAVDLVSGETKSLLTGPASPGKVVARGGGGLRSVREKIRRELERV